MKCIQIRRDSTKFGEKLDRIDRILLSKISLFLRKFRHDICEIFALYTSHLLTNFTKYETRIANSKFLDYPTIMLHYGILKITERVFVENFKFSNILRELVF